MSIDSLIIFGVHLKFEILLMILENSVLLGSFILLGLLNFDYSGLLAFLVFYLIILFSTNFIEFQFKWKFMENKFRM